jgi:hypothetical protein
MSRFSLAAVVTLLATAWAAAQLPQADPAAPPPQSPKSTQQPQVISTEVQPEPPSRTTWPYGLHLRERLHGLFHRGEPEANGVQVIGYSYPQTSGTANAADRLAPMSATVVTTPASLPLPASNGAMTPAGAGGTAPQTEQPLPR